MSRLPFPDSRALLYHAAPLHYLPSILQDGALYAQSVLAGRGIAPRASAKRRDRMLGLADYVHLSLRPDTPLLADKVRRGYPHVLLSFDRAGVLALPQTALLPYNTKAWHSRAAYAPITEPDERERLLYQHQEGRYPSLEVLVKYGLALDLLTSLSFLSDDERDLTVLLMARLNLSCPAPLEAAPALFPGAGAYRSRTGDAVAAYFVACAEAGTILPPPDLPFD